MKKQLLILMVLAGFFSCVLNKNHLGSSLKEEKLDFTKCIIASESFKYLTIKMPEGYEIKFIEREGLCEYRFFYNDGSVAYVSSDVWYGSSLNYENRNSINHTAYTKKSLLDTIALSGLQNNNLYWSEQLNGDLMVGYVNASDEKKALFNKAFLHIEKH